MKLLVFSIIFLFLVSACEDLVGKGAGTEDEDIPLLGCTDPEASNFDPIATVEDGSCEYSNIDISLLTQFVFYDYFTDSGDDLLFDLEIRDVEDDAHLSRIVITTESVSVGEDSVFTFDASGCAINTGGDPGTGLATGEDDDVPGMTTVIASCNLPVTEFVDFGGFGDYIISVSYTGVSGWEAFDEEVFQVKNSVPVPGCMDTDAVNYDFWVTVDDGSCEYPIAEFDGTGYLFVDYYYGMEYNLSFAAFPKWTLSSDVEWLSFSSSTGFGSDTVVLTVDSNEDSEDRIGIITLSLDDYSDQDTFSVEQDGMVPSEGCIDCSADDCALDCDLNCVGILNFVNLGDGICDEYMNCEGWGFDSGDCVSGCMNSDALNFDSNVTIDDGSCVFDWADIQISQEEYVYDVEDPFGVVEFTVLLGEIIVDTDNLDIDILLDDSVIVSSIFGSYCDNPMDEQDSERDTDDPVVQTSITCSIGIEYFFEDFGTYGVFANYSNEDGSSSDVETFLIVPEGEVILGCTDDSALNFDVSANVDDASCEYEDDEGDNNNNNNNNNNNDVPPPQQDDTDDTDDTTTTDTTTTSTDTDTTGTAADFDDEEDIVSEPDQEFPDQEVSEFELTKNWKLTIVGLIALIMLVVPLLMLRARKIKS